MRRALGSSISRLSSSSKIDLALASLPLSQVRPLSYATLCAPQDAAVNASSAEPDSPLIPHPHSTAFVSDAGGDNSVATSSTDRISVPALAHDIIRTLLLFLPPLRNLFQDGTIRTVPFTLSPWLGKTESRAHQQHGRWHCNSRQ